MTTATAPGMYKGRTAEQWREESRAAHKRSSDSFDRCDTDGFMSQWAADMTGMKYSRCAELAEANGRWLFRALFDTDGNMLDAKFVKGKYGMVWRIQTDGGVKWFSPSQAKKGAKRLETDRAKGYQVGMVRADAYVADGEGGAWRVYYYIAQKTEGNVEIVSAVHEEHYQDW